MTTFIIVFLLIAIAWKVADIDNKLATRPRRGHDAQPMSLFPLFRDLRGLTKEARRLADALERAFPPTAPLSSYKAADADDISYATDEGTARQELLDELHRMETEEADAPEADA